MRIALVVNRGAGTGECEATARQVEAQLRAAGAQVRSTLAETGDELVAAARRGVADGVEAVAAAGGDGTQSAVAAVLAGTGVVQGVLPFGTLNHFAKDLGIPLDLPAATRVLTQGRVVEVDVGEVNGRTFINNSSIGLYPDIVRDRERQRRRLGKGKWRALWSASLHAARALPMLRVHIAGVGERLLRESPFVFIGNNEYRMQGFSIGARERLDAGELSLYVAQRPGRFGLLRLAFRALFHRLEQARDFDVVKGSGFVIRTGRAKERVSADGEVVLLDTPLHYRVRPKALKVIVPAA
jgi:diacylglycerol kinase family enzyme